MQLECVVEVEEVLHLVVGDAAVDYSLLARVDDDEGQLDGRVGSRRSFTLLTILVSLH